MECRDLLSENDEHRNVWQYVSYTTEMPPTRFCNCSIYGMAVISELVPRMSDLTWAATKINISVCLRWMAKRQRQYNVLCLTMSMISVVYC